MPLEIEIDEHNRRVVMRASGTVCDTVALGGVARLRELALLYNDFDLLADASEVEGLPLSANAIRSIASQGPAFAASSRRALVVPSLLAYGLGRMYTAFAGERMGPPRLFRTRTAALEWLATRRDGRDAPLP